MHVHLFEISLNRRILNYCCIKSMRLPIFSIFPPFHFSGKVGLNLCNILAAMLILLTLQCGTEVFRSPYI